MSSNEHSSTKKVSFSDDSSTTSRERMMSEPTINVEIINNISEEQEQPPTPLQATSKTNITSTEAATVVSTDSNDSPVAAESSNRVENESKKEKMNQKNNHNNSSGEEKMTGNTSIQSQSTQDKQETLPSLSSLVFAHHWKKETSTTDADANTDTDKYRRPVVSTRRYSSKRRTSFGDGSKSLKKRSMTRSMIDLLNQSSEITEDVLENAASTLQRVYRGWRGRKTIDAQRLEEFILAKNPLTTLFCFLFFLAVIVLACVVETENVQYYMAHQLSDWVVEEEFTPEQASIKKNFNDIESEEELWQYLQGPFVNNLFTSDGPPHVLFPGTVLAGAVRIRQLRVKPECERMQKFVPKIFSSESGKYTGCWPSWSDGTEAKDGYGKLKVCKKICNDYCFCFCYSQFFVLLFPPVEQVPSMINQIMKFDP
jgi:hypothetical protein